jgi:hypothetical protein
VVTHHQALGITKNIKQQMRSIRTVSTSGVTPGLISLISLILHISTRPFISPATFEIQALGGRRLWGGRASLDLCGDVIDAVFWFLILRRLALIAA